MLTGIKKLAEEMNWVCVKRGELALKNAENVMQNKNGVKRHVPGWMDASHFKDFLEQSKEFSL